MSNELISVDLSAVWRYLVRRLWIAIVLSLLLAVATGLYLKVRPVFQARAILMVQAGETTQPFGGFEPGDLLEMALSPQVIEKTCGEFSKTVVHCSSAFQAQLTLQKRLLLTSKASDPATAKMALDLWIKELKSEYEKTFRLNVDQQKKHQEILLDVLKTRLQELTAKSSRDPQFQAELTEAKKNVNQAESRMLQMTVLAAAVPDVIKTVLSPSEPSIPFYDPIRYAVIMGLLSFGFLAILLLLIGAGKNAK